MMALLLLAACCIGIPPPAGSSLPAARTLSFGCSPATNSWTTAGISDFRRRHLRAREALAVQVLRLCRKAGMVSLGHVALESTKAKARKVKAMSFGCMLKAGEEPLEQEAKKLLGRAAPLDAQEDQRYVNSVGNGLPEDPQRRQNHLDKNHQAHQELEAETTALKAPEQDPW